MSKKTSKGEDEILNEANQIHYYSILRYTRRIYQKDGTRIRMTNHGQDPTMLTFNQGAMREHLRLYYRQ